MGATKKVARPKKSRPTQKKVARPKKSCPTQKKLPDPKKVARPKKNCPTQKKLPDPKKVARPKKHWSNKSGLSFELFKTCINNFLMGQMSVKFLKWYLTVFSNYFLHVKSLYPLSHYSAILLVFE